MQNRSLEDDVFERFGDYNFMWVVVWGSLVALKNYVQYHDTIPLKQLNDSISASNFMSYMADKNQWSHFKQVNNSLKDLRSRVYPNSWSTRLSNLSDAIYEAISSPWVWISKLIISTSTYTPISELERIDNTTSISNDVLKIPVVRKEIQEVYGLANSLRGYFQQRLDKIDATIVSVQTELEKEYELNLRFNLIKEWDSIVEPLYANDAIEFCKKVQEYMQQKDNIEEDKPIYTNVNSKKELFFNAPQHKVKYKEQILEQAEEIGSKLKGNKHNPLP